MKNLGFKIEKRSPSDTSREAASRVATEIPPTQGSTPSLAPAPSPAPPGDSQPGSAVAPGAFSAATETTYYDSRDEFDYEGKLDGVMYGDKSNHTSFAYSPALCSHTTLDPIHTDHPHMEMGGLSQDKMGGLSQDKMGSLHISNDLSVSRAA